MDVLETLVRDSFAAHEERAPEGGDLLRAVRGGVARRRRRRTGAMCGALALVAAAVGTVLAWPRPTGPALIEFSGHNPPVPPATILAHRPPPTMVTDAARALSREFAPHLPAAAVWVRTTLNAWYALEGQSPVAADGPAYVVEVRLAAPARCVTCKGLAPVYGRFGIAVIDVNGGDGGEGVVTNVDYPLDRLGALQVLGYDY